MPPIKPNSHAAHALNVITIDSIVPTIIEEDQPVKLTWSVTLGEHADARNVTVTLLTDDARVLIVESGNDESPPERTIPAQPGQKITKTMTIQLQRRKGLVEDAAKDGSTCPMCIVARARNERGDIIASGAAVDVEIVGLAKRIAARIFM